MLSENSDENKDLRPAEQLLVVWLEVQTKKNTQKNIVINQQGLQAPNR